MTERNSDGAAIESLLDGLPIVSMAALVRATPDAIRDATRGAILNAVQHGVAPEEAVAGSASP